MKLYLRSNQPYETTMVAHDQTMQGSWRRKVLCFPNLENSFWRHQGAVLKRNGRKGLENEFLIERKVEQPKTTQKSHWKLTFKKERVVSRLQSAAYALLWFQIELRERMAKKDEKFSEFMEFFDAKNDRPNKAKTNNQTYLIASERSVTF